MSPARLNSAKMSGDFTPFEDAFPSPDVFKNGESTLDEKFRAAGDKAFGKKKTEEDMKTLVGEFKKAVEKEGLAVKGERFKNLAWID